jgi:hypothetical protein
MIPKPPQHMQMLRINGCDQHFNLIPLKLLHDCLYNESPQTRLNTHRIALHKPS